MSSINLSKHLNLLSTGLFLFLIVPSNSYAQVDEFEKYKTQQEQEFQAYKDKFDKEFVEMLNKTWKELGVKVASKNYETPKPEKLPEAPPPPPPPKPDVNNNRPEDKVIGEDIEVDDDIIIDVPAFELPEPKKIEKVRRDALYADIPVSTMNVSYFSSTVPISFPQPLNEKIKASDYRSGKIDNKKIAKFWDEISNYDHRELIKYTLDVKQELGLNDWGYVLLVNDISKSIYGSKGNNLVRLMNWFILSKAGYEMKIAYDQNGVYNLFTVENNVFNQKYYTLDGDKFFPINFNEEKQTPSSIFTYSGKHGAQVRKLDLTIDQFPQFIEPSFNVEKTLSFDFKGKNYKIPVTVNKQVVSYFEYYPLTDLPVFFTANFSKGTGSSLISALKKTTSEMNELDAVNFLLRMVQKSFQYKTDQDNFDREKYMIPEETLFYPYSDCDDRSILFATLVREVLGMEAVGLRYSRHLAVAVHFNSEVEGDYHMHNGKKFTVADPTYINAPVGLTMTNYKNEKPKIVSF